MVIKLPSLKLRFKLNVDVLAELAFVLFFSNSLIRLLFTGIFGYGTISTWVPMLIPYTVVLLICAINPRKYIKLDFVILLMAVTAFFAVTYLIHPEYEFDYMRADYGVWDHVLMPTRGLYAFLFIRLISEPKRILKCMRMSGWCLMPYFLYRVIRGNWTLVSASGLVTHTSYSVTFGYEILIFALVFLLSALNEKKLLYFAAAIADIVMIFIGGSRGPILFIGLFVVLYLLIYIRKSRRKGLIIASVILAVIILYEFYTPILVWIMGILERHHLSSRFIRMFLEGTINDDNRRAIIWTAAINMIKENIFGYGAMGSRHVIHQYVYAGYPHNIILEFFIDYGVIPGGLMLLGMFGYSMSILFSEKKKEWCDVFLPFFCAACSMMISLTYWSRPEFWSCLAIGMCCHYDMMRKKKHSLETRNTGESVWLKKPYEISQRRIV